jgi:hypothetical protein
LHEPVAIQLAEQAFRGCKLKMNRSSAEGRQLVEEGQQPKAEAGGHRGTLGERENDGSTSAGMSRQSISVRSLKDDTSFL